MAPTTGGEERGGRKEKGGEEENNAGEGRYGCSYKGLIVFYLILLFEYFG